MSVDIRVREFLKDLENDCVDRNTVTKKKRSLTRFAVFFLLAFLAGGLYTLQAGNRLGGACLLAASAVFFVVVLFGLMQSRGLLLPAGYFVGFLLAWAAMLLTPVDLYWYAVAFLFPPLLFFADMKAGMLFGICSTVALSGACLFGGGDGFEHIGAIVLPAYVLHCIAVFGTSYTLHRERNTNARRQQSLKEELSREKQKVSLVKLQTIRAISNAVDARDRYTKHHSERVARYCVMLARNLGWTEEQIDRLETMALLHDIGKIGVTDRILLSEEKLSLSQFEEIKQHTLIGAEILKDFALVPYASVGALSHHERYDGTGYPYGLKGEDIPLEARIIGICDAFDAMNSNRTYRGKLTDSGVIRELVKGSGTQFDPKLLEAFLPVAWKILEEEKISVS